MAHYILFDTETTGTGEQDRIIQVGAMVLHNNEAPQVYNELCQAEVPIALEAMEVHNITPEQLEGKPSYKELDFTKMIDTHNNKENYLIAHNINFDLAMLIKEGFANNYTLIDTLRCAKHLLPDSPYHRLQYLRFALELYKKEQAEATKLGIELNAHDALSDVVFLKLLMSHLVAMIKEQELHTNPMAYLAELTQTPVLLKTFRFGKYKGQNIEEIAKTDTGYLDWMLKNMQDMDEDLRYSIGYWLGK